MSSCILVRLQAKSYILVSSTKTLQQIWTHSGKALVKIVKSIGPNTLPCGIPLCTSLADQSFPTLTLGFFAMQSLQFTFTDFLLFHKRYQSLIENSIKRFLTGMKDVSICLDQYYAGQLADC